MLTLLFSEGQWNVMGKVLYIFVCFTVHGVNTVYNEVQLALKGHFAILDYAILFIHLHIFFHNCKFDFVI